MQLAPLYPYLHRVLQPAFPDCLWHGRKDTPTIALTFDDGPHPHHTPQLLKVLDKYNIPASFFCLGICIERSPAITRAIYEQGHWIGLHGYTHRSFPFLSTVELQQDLERTQAAIAQACLLSPPRVRDVRPPNGLFTPSILKHLCDWNYRPVMWSVVPEDWVSPGYTIVAERVLRQTTAGSLIVLHDGYHGGQDVAETVDFLIPQLLNRGYQFTTIDQFWAEISP